MRVLLIKTSSMGDLIHTLPALTDAASAYPAIIFDWVAEEAFAEIPKWHPQVEQTIPIGLRRLRKNIFSHQTRMEWREVRKQLRAHDYDIILDAQGLLKSAFLGLFAKGKRVGLNWHSAREPLASLMYQHSYSVNFYQHAVHRMRSLFSLAIGYKLPSTEANFAINKQQFINKKHADPYLVFLHSTTWDTKLWPEKYWCELAKFAASTGYRIKMSGGNDFELDRAKRIAQNSEGVDVLPRLRIVEMAELLSNAAGVVAVDTGFGHLAAALAVPTISLYGPTNPKFTGAIGPLSQHLVATFPCAPCLKKKCHYQLPSDVKPACFSMLSPAVVWQALSNLITDTCA